MSTWIFGAKTALVSNNISATLSKLRRQLRGANGSLKIAKAASVHILHIRNGCTRLSLMSSRRTDAHCLEGRIVRECPSPVTNRAV